MRFLSLFTGGGIDLGFERAGLTCIGQVEIDPFCLKALAARWPNVPRLADVRTFRGDEFGPFDVLTGGYPCQPFSTTGQRKGESDPRHLWPEVHRIIRAVRPRYVFLENVTGHLSLGFKRVLGDLTESGYDAEWQTLPANAFGAPHLRERLFIVAYPFGERQAVLEPTPWRAAEGYAPLGDRLIACGGWWLENQSNLRVGDGVPFRLARHRMRVYGNAVVPQVAEHFARLILEANKRANT